MPEFFNVQPVSEALERLFSHWTPSFRTQTHDPRQLVGRVLAKEIRSPLDLPTFPRSTVDGYAVRAADTFGASPALPAYLTCIGTIPMGAAAEISLNMGQAAEIHTGGMLPAGADAVVMIEKTQPIDEHDIEVFAPVAPGENVIQVGEDIAQDDLILPAGHLLRPQDIGGLLAVGILEAETMLPPRVGILSCGDELVAPEENPPLGQIRDINAYTLAALVEQAGGNPISLGIARDTLDNYLAYAQKGSQQVDMLVMTAGSSVSTRDLTRQVIEALGEPGVLQHGLAVKPGKPTLLAICQNKPVIGLPGNPVSALLVARQILIPLIHHALAKAAQPPVTIKAVLMSNIPSTTGREDTIPVKLMQKEGVWLAEPVFGKSNLIYTLVRADGLVSIPLNSSGLRAGTEVEVFPL